MRIQVQVGANVVPVGEAALLHAGHEAHQVGALGGHEVTETVDNLLVIKKTSMNSQNQKKVTFLGDFQEN